MWVYPEGGLSAHLFPNPAKGEAVLRVYPPEATPPGLSGAPTPQMNLYRVRLRAGGQEALAEGCAVLTLPREGGPFRLEASPGPHRLLAFLDRDGNGLLDRDEPWTEAQVSAPARGVRLLVR